jgi:hypothetical protein
MSGQTGLYGLNEPALPQKPKSRVWKYIKILMVLLVLFLISLATLHRTGGNGDNLKSIVETYLSDTSGYKAKVGKLNAVSFYPLIGIDVEDVTFETPELVKVARIGKLNFSTSFWSAASGESVHTLDVSDVDVDAGIATPGKMRIERFFIDAKNKKLPQLSLTGFYAGKPVMLTADLRVIPGMLGGVYFNFAEPSALDLVAGDIHVTGQVLTTFSGRALKIDKFSVNGKTRPVQMAVALSAMEKMLSFNGKVQNGETVFDYDVSYSGKKGRRVIKGTVKGEKADLNDLTGGTGLFSDYKVFYDFWMAGQKQNAGNALMNADLDLGLNITHFINGGKDLGVLEGHAKIKDGVLNVDPPASKAGHDFAAAMNAYFKK